MDETIRKKKPKTVWIIIAVTLVLAVVILVAIVAKTGSTEYRLKRQLEIADRYLSELKYEQAVAAYELAIEIDPMSVEAYLGLAEAYIGKGDQEAAGEALKRGIERVSDERLIKKLADLYLDEANELVAVELYESALELLRKGYVETNDQRIEDKIKEIEELLDEIENRKNERSESVELPDKERKSAPDVWKLVCDYYDNAYEENLGYGKETVSGDTLSMTIMKLDFGEGGTPVPYEWIDVEVNMKNGKMTGSDGLETILW